MKGPGCYPWSCAVAQPLYKLIDNEETEYPGTAAQVASEI